MHCYSFVCAGRVCVFQQRTLFDLYYNKFIFHVVLDSDAMLFVRFPISVFPHIHCLDQVSPVYQTAYI
jgi:hypothetical protein